MPIYEYTCKDCNKNFEEIVLSQDEIPNCPECKSTNTDKLISASRHQSGANAGGMQSFAPQGGKSSCGGCSGGSCSTCG